jgi:hypothetical protein
VLPIARHGPQRTRDLTSVHGTVIDDRNRRITSPAESASTAKIGQDTLAYASLE